VLTRHHLTLLLLISTCVCTSALASSAWAEPPRPVPAHVVRPAEPPGPAPARAAAQSAEPVPAGDYVGSDTCATCHEAEAKGLTGTQHARAANPRTPMATHGCESCHGAGKAHVDAGGDASKIVSPSKLLPQRASEICTSCHDRGTHALWSGSQHDQRNVGCVTCHSVHAPKGEKQIKAASQMELCGTCHKNVVNRQHRFTHMPVREGKVECTSCHNPHGSANVKLLKVGTTVDDSCTSCHSEKRGPHLWEHAPVSNSCVTCHNPHGSNNERLLEAKLPYLCQRCHVTSRHPPTVYDGFVLKNSTNANKIISRGCVNCHQQIHGSNSPSGQMFLR
jgi:DmsE family decaheme c-type cytochrome